MTKNDAPVKIQRQNAMAAHFNGDIDDGNPSMNIVTGSMGNAAKLNDQASTTVTLILYERRT